MPKPPAENIKGHLRMQPHDKAHNLCSDQKPQSWFSLHQRVCIPNSAWAILSQEGCHPPQGWDKVSGWEGKAQLKHLRWNVTLMQRGRSQVVNLGRAVITESSQGLLVSLFGAPRADPEEGLGWKFTFFEKWRQESQVGSGEARQSRRRANEKGTPQGTLWDPQRDSGERAPELSTLRTRTPGVRRSYPSPLAFLTQQAVKRGAEAGSGEERLPCWGQSPGWSGNF